MAIAGDRAVHFLDYDRDGHLDLFVANYLEFDLQSVGKPGSGSTCNWKGVPVMCGPRGLPPGTPALYRNNGNGTFIGRQRGFRRGQSQGRYMMTVVTADFNNDGWPDIYVACDSTPSFLFATIATGPSRISGWRPALR